MRVYIFTHLAQHKAGLHKDGEADKVLLRHDECATVASTPNLVKHAAVSISSRSSQVVINSHLDITTDRF
jgi:hypothetical protein